MGKTIKLADEVFNLLTEVKEDFGFTTMNKTIESLISRKRLIGDLLDDFKAEIIPLLQRSGGGNQEVTDKVVKPKRTKQDIWDKIRSVEGEYKSKAEFCQDFDEVVRLSKEKDEMIKALFKELSDKEPS